MPDDPYSFEFHDELCPAIWQPDSTLKPEIRKKLLRIASAFADYLQVGTSKVPVADIIFTGSLANYNYSKSFSDIDLHLIVDMTKILSYAKDIDAAREYVTDLYMAKKAAWNTAHHLIIEGFPVELYAQDLETLDIKKSAGAYSILNGEWIERPNQEEPVIDQDSVDSKADDLMDQIDFVIEHGSVNSFQVMKDKIKQMRQAGLDSGGEFSVENLAFKVLRRTGYVQKLWDAETGVEDKDLLADSLRESNPYLSVGHNKNPKTALWLYDESSRSIKSFPAASSSHGSHWTRKELDQSYHGRYDADDHRVSFVFPPAIIYGEQGRTYGWTPSEDDVPESVYSALRRAFPEFSSITVYS